MTLIVAAAAAATAPACSRAPANSPAQAQASQPNDATAAARPSAASGLCRDLPSAASLKEYLRRAPAEGGEAGGLFSGKMEWAAVVNRHGELCSAAVATDDPAAAWPGSQAIAKAKAYTANAYSTDLLPMSTARLYTLAQPGHSLYGITSSNTFDPGCLETPLNAARTNGKICGGSIAFGGGVPLYKGKVRIGGLGVSGDTACTDHEIAKRIRHIAQLDPERGALVDDIMYATAGGSSVFTHPLCPNTWLNGKKVGDELRASGY